MKFFHVVRNSPDWLELAKDYNAHVFNNNVKESLKKVFNDWSRIFSPNYFIIRNEIAKIAKENYDKIKFDKVWLSSLNIEKDLKNESKFIVAFSDDDDWYHPDLVKFIKYYYEKNPDVDAITWNHSAFCNNYKIFDAQKNSKMYSEPYFIVNKEKFFHTNNYVLTNNFFKKITSDDINVLHYGLNYDLHYGHNIIDQFFKQKINTGKINETLSMANKSITSYSYFWDFKVEDLITIVKKCQDIEIKIPNEYKWAEKEIQETMSIFKKINFRKFL